MPLERFEDTPQLRDRVVVHVDPQVDLRARRVISGVETFVRVQGSMRQPEMTFSSSPPLDQADILSLIVFNVPINELGEGQQVSLVERAGALAGGYLVSGLSSTAALERWKRTETERSLREAQLVALRHPLNPHFIFNALSSIRSLVLEDAARAKQLKAEDA